MIQRVKFPNIDFTLPLKSNYYDPKELYELLSEVSKVELGGEYDLKNGFIVDPKVSNYDKTEDRPYTSLNVHTKLGVVWHSHPFDSEYTSYPSIEDMDVVRMYPELIFLLLTKKGIYVMSATKPYISVDGIVRYYRSMQPETTDIDWNYEELEESFINNIGYTSEKIHTYGIFCNLIPLNHIDKLKNAIIESYKYKDKSIRKFRFNTID